ncbi:hypothetical protein SAMN05216223_101285 [Actinacidiphila yanglinensis]|uniref:Uncharacterized protein n=1 Tax=Actinacidiphila yanglinensis TaxID=310779 RepID=A0A1H5SUP8_9ACTN|nr:hypothetical protein SAMN05216223_101285 [Actinacidiphila yanglinensis]
MDVFQVGPGGAAQVLDVPPGCSDLAGFERWRTTVWGSDAARSLGARFLPVLAEGDLYVWPGQVGEFLDECALLRAGLDALVPGLAGADPGRAPAEHRRRISARLANIEAAARRALREDGGVLVW